jgi:hypothetical protein
MSGQLGFQATDPLPPMSGPTFAAEDIDDLGVGFCLTIWQRLQIEKRGKSLSESRASLRSRSILPRSWRRL